MYPDGAYAWSGRTFEQSFRRRLRAHLVVAPPPRAYEAPTVPNESDDVTMELTVLPERSYRHEFSFSGDGRTDWHAGYRSA